MQVKCMGANCFPLGKVQGREWGCDRIDLCLASRNRSCLRFLSHFHHTAPHCNRWWSFYPGNEEKQHTRFLWKSPLFQKTPKFPLWWVQTGGIAVDPQMVQGKYRLCWAKKIKECHKETSSIFPPTLITQQIEHPGPPPLQRTSKDSEIYPITCRKVICAEKVFRQHHNLALKCDKNGNFQIFWDPVTNGRWGPSVWDETSWVLDWQANRTSQVTSAFTPKKLYACKQTEMNGKRSSQQ